MKMVLPPDWGKFQPRRWQAECLPKLVAHYNQEKPSRGIVRAIMGAGKAMAIAQLCACCSLEPNEVIVVSTSSIYLVEELEKSIRERLEADDFMSEKRVGSYYTFSKDINVPIIVTCMPSVPELAEKLSMHSRSVALWIPDECHRTETDGVKNAYEILMPKAVCGWTATPFRADKRQGLSLFDELLYDYGPGAAIKDGNVIVPWVTKNYEGNNETSVDDALYSMIKDSKGPGIINADSIADAEDYAKYLNERGFPAEAVHSKMTQADIRSRLVDLQNGKLRAVIHCNLLQEGANFPFIMWMGLRRAVGSRNRFVQEIGRGLRAYTNPVTGEVKQHCIYYDIRDLFSVFSLNYEAVLGGDYEEPLAKDPAKEAENALVQEAFELMREMVKAKSNQTAIPVQPLASYLTAVIHAFDVCRLIDRKIVAREWRTQAASDKQLNAVSQLRYATQRKIVPGIHQKALGMLSDFKASLNKGMASDLISIEVSLAERKQWPDFKNLDANAEEGLDRHQKRGNVKIVHSEPAAGKTVQKVAPVEQGLLFEVKRTK